MNKLKKYSKPFRIALIYLFTLAGSIAIGDGVAKLREGPKIDKSSLVVITSKGLFKCRKGLEGIQVNGFGCVKL